MNRPLRLTIASLLIAAIGLSTQLSNVLAGKPQPAPVPVPNTAAIPVVQTEATAPTVWSEHRLPTPDGMLAYTRIGQGPLLVVIPGGLAAQGRAQRR